MRKMIVTSPAFEEGGWIPKKHSARGLDVSPEIHIKNIPEKAVSLAITLDDASHPLFPNYNHWLIWNVPVQELIPEGVEAGYNVPSLRDAKQGCGYGKNRYKGPKPPLRTIHTYVFTVYALDSKLELSKNSAKNDLIKAMNGHILEQAVLSGKFQSHRKE